MSDDLAKQIEGMIEGMIKRPAMFATNGHELEGSIRTAVACWSLAKSSNENERLRALYRDEVERVNERIGQSPQMLPPANVVVSLVSLWEKANTAHRAMQLVADSWANIWQKLTNPVDALAALVEEEDK